MLVNAVDQEIGFIMTYILLQRSATIARMFTSVTGAPCLLAKPEKYQSNKLIQLEEKDIRLQASAQSNGHGMTTPENRTST